MCCKFPFNITVLMETTKNLNYWINARQRLTARSINVEVPGCPGGP